MGNSTPGNTSTASMQPQDLGALAQAKQLLESPSLAIKLSDTLGTPVEKGFALLPANWRQQVNKTVNLSLDKALGLAVKTMDTGKTELPSNRWHKLAVAGSGGLGGAFGLASVAVELPISTTLMLRSIADIARSEGEDLHHADAALACLQVFALGGTAEDDDEAETGYLLLRSQMASLVSNAAEHIAVHGLSQEGAPALVKLISSIAQRFGVVVSEKVAAQIVPIVGAAGGAMVNWVFMEHYQNMASGHFTMRRLEREYGEELVWEQYRAIDPLR